MLRRLGSIRLETPFKDMSSSAVLLFLCCCYQPLAIKEHLDAALANKSGRTAVQEMLRLLHMVEAPLLQNCCIDHLLSRVATIQGGLMGWLSAAEECHATSLLHALKQCMMARLQDKTTFRATAADFAASTHKVDKATVVSILEGVTTQLMPRLVEVEVSWTQGHASTAPTVLPARQPRPPARSPNALMPPRLPKEQRRARKQRLREQLCAGAAWQP